MVADHGQSAAFQNLRQPTIVAGMTPDSEKPETSERPALTLGAFLPYRLSVLSNTISAAIAETYGSRFGLTLWQWRCMAVIGETPGLAARDVAARTAMDKVAVSRALAGLEALGHVTRDASPSDRRASRLSLTPSGRAVYAEIVPLALAHEARLLAAFDAGEIEQLQSMLSRLARAVRPEGPPLW